jgi:hypothetical protein
MAKKPDIQSHIEVLRLHCEHLRTLLDQVISELTTIEHELATDGNYSFSIVAPHLNELEKQSAHLATETVRLQSFLQSLGLQRTDTFEAAGESPQSSLPTAATPQMGRCKIVCSLDGQVEDIRLYDRYADLETRTFPNDRYAMLVQDYLIVRARGMRWDAEPPNYQIVPADE